MTTVPGAYSGFGAHIRPTGGGYTTTANDYDGTNDYATRGAGLTGAADGKEGTFSCWLRLDGGDSSALRVIDTATPIQFVVVRNPSNKIVILGRNTSAITIMSLTSTTSYTVASPGGWFHVLGSWNLATPEAYLYINDADDEASSTETNDTIDYTQTDWSIGAAVDGTLKFNGCISELWFEDTFINITTEANRRKFIDASGKPVDLGSDGSTPTGASPLIYVPDGDPSTNAGTGGNFTITGALSACSNSPSD